MNISINPTFQALIPPLSQEERSQLEENLIADGCREPLATWNGEIVDGHNRFAICTEHGIEFSTFPLEFADVDEACAWIIRNQFGRRNLSPFCRAGLVKKLEPLIAAKAKENLKASGEEFGKGSTKSSNPIEPINTRKELAKLAGISEDTLAKARLIEAEADEETKDKLRRGEKGISINSVATEIKERKQAEVPDEENNLEQEYSRAMMLADSSIRMLKQIKRGHPQWRESLERVNDLTMRKLGARRDPAEVANQLIETFGAEHARKIASAITLKETI